MKNILPVLSLVGISVIVFLLATGLQAENSAKPVQTAISPVEKPTTESFEAADAIMNEALSELAKHDSIQAKIRQQMHMMGHALIGEGLYLQSISGDDTLLRMELKVQVADQLCSELQVSDGRDLWIESQECSDRRVQRVDVREVEHNLRKLRPRISTLGGGRMPLGGLPEWLHSLYVNFQFSYAGETELSGVPVSMLIGHWRQANLAEMLPDQEDAILAGRQADLSKLENHLPHEVVLLLGQDDRFPYLIDYRRYVSVNDNAAPEAKSLLRVQIYEVRFNSPLDMRQFVYQPGPVDVINSTTAYTRLLLKRAARQRAFINE